MPNDIDLAALVEVRTFQRSDQEPARELIESGLGEHFGYVDANANPICKTSIRRISRSAMYSSSPKSQGSLWPRPA
jgi:hypothetical protein